MRKFAQIQQPEGLPDVKKKEPAVEPPQPPMKLMKMSSTGRNAGHSEKSAIEKPVLVITEITSNAATRRICRLPPAKCSTSIIEAVSRVPNTISSRNSRTSALRQ